MARPKITGRKTKISTRQRRDLSWIAPAAYGIQEFCDAHRNSRSKYYELKAKGLTPDEMLVDGRRKISVEAAARWRAERESAAASSSAA
jgi:hypothetical protein